MISVLRLLQDLDSELKITGETGGIEDTICMTRSKGRFGQPTSGGWADIMINFYFKDDKEGWAHICEIQIVHAQLYSIRKNMGAHKTYNDFRAALELYEKVGADPEEGGGAAVFEALKWKPGPRRPTGTSVVAHRSTLVRPGKLVAVLESQVEKMAALEAQNEKMSAQMEDMAAQMKNMSVVLATLAAKTPSATEVARADL